MVGPKISLMRIGLLIIGSGRPKFGPGLRRIAHPHRDHLRPARPAPVVEPAGDHFSGGAVVAEHVVEMAMLDSVVEELTQRAEFEIVAHKAAAIELGGLQDDFDLVIVACRRAQGCPVGSPPMMCEAENAKCLAIVYMAAPSSERTMHSGGSSPRGE